MKITRMTKMKLIDDNEDAYEDNCQNCLPSWWSLDFVYIGMRMTRMAKMRLVDDYRSLVFVLVMMIVRWTKIMVMMVGGLP